MVQYDRGADNFWIVECRDKDGRLKWRDGFWNLVPTVGANKLLDATFKTGLASPAWYVGLTSSSPTVSDNDTMSSHSGWTEFTSYASVTRPTYTPGTISAGSVDNSASKASFTINGSGTVGGCFMVDSSTKGGTSGTLYGVGAFVSGNQAVVALDVVNVTCILTISSTSTGGFMPIKEESFGTFHP